ncbi:L-2-hydroxyglutarate oxidase [Fodinibius sp. Rm-B-1B1-1]|uniref:L-2-hydroxyglutarate oxidase n=1 Tax=Fodinibius alkaliphilus TaxID=3140241 RepID=UPI003159C7A4
MYNFIIVGGGIVGLSTAYAIKKRNPASAILILEKESHPAAHQTGRNSGVIHSGIYYKPGSKKAELATRGSVRMIQFCKDHGIKYEQCGKVIVATNKDELPYLDILQERGIQNGLNVRKITEEELAEREPHVTGKAALYVPEAGIVSYKNVAEVLVDRLKDYGVEIGFNQYVKGIKCGETSCEVRTQNCRFKGRYIINCGGLQSDRIANETGANVQHRIVPFRGEYYEIVDERRHLVNNLIYPVPNPSFPFLGVHFTRMIDGSIHAGPNAVLSLKREGYSKYSFDFVDAWSALTYPGFWKLAGKHWREGFRELHRSLSKSQFVKSLQKLIPEIREEDLVPSNSGVRAQALNRDGSLVDDFLIKYHGRTIHVCNAPSPAATASLEIGDQIADYVMKHQSTGVAV